MTKKKTKLDITIKALENHMGKHFIDIIKNKNSEKLKLVMANNIFNKLKYYNRLEKSL